MGSAARRVVVEKVAATAEPGADTGRKAAIACGRIIAARGLMAAMATVDERDLGKRMSWQGNDEVDLDGGTSEMVDLQATVVLCTVGSGLLEFG